MLEPVSLLPKLSAWMRLLPIGGRFYLRGPVRAVSCSPAGEVTEFVPLVREAARGLRMSTGPALRPTGRAGPAGAAAGRNPSEAPDVIDASERFQARGRRRGGPLESDEREASGGEESAAVRMDEWRGAADLLAAPLRISGEGLLLWYRIDADTLARVVRPLPVISWMGRAAVALCVGRYDRLEKADGRSVGLPGDFLAELTLVALVRGALGPELYPLGRLVDAASRSVALRGLANQLPRELAWIGLEHRAKRWSLVARWRSGPERLELEVEEHSLFNSLGAPALLSRLLSPESPFWPVAGRNARLERPAAGGVCLGRVKSLVLPDRLHQGLLPPEEGASPFAVMLLPSLRLRLGPG